MKNATDGDQGKKKEGECHLRETEANGNLL